VNIGHIWVVLGFLVVAITKYATSVRLRHLTERVHQDQQDASQLRYKLAEAAERETQLKTETERLQAKVTALRNVVSNLEKSLQRYSGPVAPASSD